MACSTCSNIAERKDLPHVIRQCKSCGREMHIHEPGKHGIGFKVEKGEKVVIPSNFLKLSLNPLKSTGTFSRAGMDWFARLIFADLPKKDQLQEELNKINEKCSQILTSSKHLRDSGIDFSKDGDENKVYENLKNNTGLLEWWYFLQGAYGAALENALQANNVKEAVWAMLCLERCRAMAVYKEHVEEVVYMGHSAKK